ncbi:MAG: type II secretion system protein [Elusimicrobiaceae bacterium]|nr:type II secretion system protein [Elusimicrobiaceae bacterium]
MNNRLTKKAGMTLLEILVVVILSAIMLSIGISSLSSSSNKAKEREAYARAQLIWHAEKRQFAFKGAYQALEMDDDTNWILLGMKNFNKEDRHYTYELITGNQGGIASFTLTVTKRNDTHGFKLDSLFVRTDF